MSDASHSHNIQSTCPTYHKLFETSFEEFVVNSKASRMFNRRERILDHELDVDVDPYLV